MTLIFLLLTMLVPLPKQGDDTISLNPNRTTVLRLHGDAAFAAASYTADGGEVVTITADTDGALDLVLELLGPDGSSITYADAPDTDAPALWRVPLVDAGRYTVRVNTFNGEGVGEVEVNLIVGETLMLTPDAPTLWVPLGRSEVAAVVVAGFDGRVTITARDPRGLLDPRIALVGADGAAFAQNDDHAGAEAALNRFDARLTAALPENTTLQITEFLGRAGWIEVSINP